MQFITHREEDAIALSDAASSVSATTTPVGARPRLAQSASSFARERPPTAHLSFHVPALESASIEAATRSPV